MRILVVTAWYPSVDDPATGAFVEKDVLTLAAAHDVEVLHLVAPRLASGDPFSVRGGVVVRQVPMDPARPDHWIRASRAARRLARGFDVVHTMAFPSLLPFLARRPGVPWVHTEHWSGISNPSSLPWAWRAAMPLLGRALARPDAVTAVCEYLARPVGRLRRGPVEVVPCVVEPPDAVVPRPRAGRLVAVGGLVPGKDPLTAVDALALLAADVPDVSLTWVGDGPLREDVLRRAGERGVADRLRLVGRLPAPRVFAELDRADLFLLPTLRENFCVSAAEALVHGRPVVAGANGGHAEYLDPAVGELVGTQSGAAYARAVCAVLGRTAELSAADVAATVGDRFSAATVRRGYESAYRQVMR
ncbi:glycosyltransferase [Cellulosimicrobium sp. NPDC055967]|uniref:glycosyltransferase n=1 Tax=Cellulosimicrobium sp. NPDC055967 TaxID=3345670 RepID=UPI0035E1EF56